LIPPHLLRGRSRPAEVSEVEVVRHYTRMSQWNYAIDLGFYPLGSCTMKYNPRVNEDVARLPGFSKAHPYCGCAGAGRARAPLGAGARSRRNQRAGPRHAAPVGGAHGELTGVMMIRAYHQAQGSPRREDPHSRVGPRDNPAARPTLRISGRPDQIGPRGVVEPQAVARHGRPGRRHHAHEPEHARPLRGAHRGDRPDRPRPGRAGLRRRGQSDAIMGITRPGDWGVDVLQFNLHKTFSQPTAAAAPAPDPWVSGNT